MKASSIERFGSDVYRNTLYIEKLDLAFSQFFIRSPSGGYVGVSTGMRADFAQLEANLRSVGIEVGEVGSIVAPHFEADEIAALPEFSSRHAGVVAYAHPICAHALADIFSVKTKPLKDEVPITISGERVVPIFTTHVHQWDALVLYVPRLKALFSSDIFMSYGPVDASGDALRDPLRDIIGSIEKSGYLPSLAHLHAALMKIRKYDIDWIFPMHGPAITSGIPQIIDGLIQYCTAASAREVAE
jgi:flavorubredoxin